MPYDHYQETEELIDMLRRTSLHHFGEALQTAMDEGATGTEIFMALRWNIDKLLLETSMNDLINIKAKRLKCELEKCLE